MKNFAQFQAQVGDKVYHLFADALSNWGDVKNALVELMIQVSNAEAQFIANQQSAQKQSQEPQNATIPPNDAAPPSTEVA